MEYWISKGILHNVDFGLHAFDICGESLLELDADYELEHAHVEWESSGVMDCLVEQIAAANMRRSNFNDSIGAE